MALNLSPLRSIKTRIALLMLSLFLVSVWSLALYVGRTLRQDMQMTLGQHQLSIATFLATEVQQHLADHLRALDVAADSLGPTMTANAAKVQSALDQRPVLFHSFNAGVVVVDVQGKVIAEAPALGRMGANYMDRDHIASALREGKTTIGKPVQGRTVKAPLLAMAAPIRDAQGQVVGAISGLNRLDKPGFLDQISSAGYGATGGYLLVAPQYGLVVTSSIKSRILAALPPEGTSPLVDRNRRGFEGTTIDVDPLGDEVLTSVKQVPLAGWFVAVRMTTAEAFAPIAVMQRRLLLATLLLTLLVGVLVWWALRRQLAPMMRSVQTMSQMTDGQLPLRPLAVEHDDEVGRMVRGFNQLQATLQQREAMLQRIFDTASVAIFLIDQGKCVRQANQRMAQMFACQPHLLEGSAYLDLVHPTEREVAAQNTIALIASAVPSVDLERHYLRADQSDFWGHLTCRSYVDDASGESMLVCVIADITERRQARSRNQRLTQLYAALSQSNDAIVHSRDEIALFQQVCRVLVEVGGMRTAFVGRAEADQLRAVAKFGAGIQLLADVLLPLTPLAPQPRGLSASAWCSAEPVWCQDYLNDARNEPWLATAAQLGWASAASLPLFATNRWSGCSPCSPPMRMCLTTTCVACCWR